MSSWKFCSSSEPHDSHEWNESEEIVEPVSGGREVVWSSYYHCPGVRATSELVRLMDARDLARAKLEAAEQAMAEESVKCRSNVCDFYLAERDCSRPEFQGHRDEWCLGCPRKESAT